MDVGTICPNSNVHVFLKWIFLISSATTTSVDLEKALFPVFDATLLIHMISFFTKNFNTTKKYNNELASMESTGLTTILHHLDATGLTEGWNDL